MSLLFKKKTISSIFLSINIIILILLLVSCATVGTSPHLDYIKTHDGNYLALPPRAFTQSEVDQLGVKYGASVRYALSNGPIATVTESFLDSSIGPSSYRRGIANEIETMLDSKRVWNILIIPENRNFMVSVLKLIPYGRKESPVKILQLAEITPELTSELERLSFSNLEK